MSLEALTPATTSTLPLVPRATVTYNPASTRSIAPDPQFFHGDLQEELLFDLNTNILRPYPACYPQIISPGGSSGPHANITSCMDLFSFRYGIHNTTECRDVQKGPVITYGCRCMHYANPRMAELMEACATDACPKEELPLVRIGYKKYLEIHENVCLQVLNGYKDGTTWHKTMERTTTTITKHRTEELGYTFPLTGVVPLTPGTRSTSYLAPRITQMTFTGDLPAGTGVPENSAGRVGRVRWGTWVVVGLVALGSMMV